MHTTNAARAAAAPANGAPSLDARKEAYLLAALTGYDHRTCLKALLHGADAIHPQRMREELRPHVEARRTANVQVKS